MNLTLWMVYSDAHSSQLWVTSTVNGDIVPHSAIPNPSQNDLRNTGPDPGWWLEVNPTQFFGQKIGDAVINFAVQRNDDQVKINYIFLYAYQGGQTLEGRTGLPNAFTAFIVDTGAHVGDLERFAVYLLDNHDGTYTFDRAEFEAHGDIYGPYTHSQMDWDQSSHPIVCIALHGHGIWNQKDTGNPVRIKTVPTIVCIGDWLGDITSDAPLSGLWWRPWSQSSDVFKQIGLDSNDQPINDQAWAALCGRLGPSGPTEFKKGFKFDDSDLPGDDEFDLNGFWTIAKMFKLIQAELLQADGPREKDMDT